MKIPNFLSPKTETASPFLTAPIAPPPALSVLDLPAPLQDDIRFLSTLCTRLWRFERQLQKVADEEPNENHTRLTRRFESVIEALKDAKIEIIDHDGEKYDAGMTLTVLQWEPREELNREVIIETVRPTLRLRGMLIAGEVIVGQPIAVEPEPETETETVHPVIEEAQTEIETTEPVIETTETIAEEMKP